MAESAPLIAYTAGNQVALLRNGTEYFPALIEAIEQAHTKIHLQTYIFEADATGQLVIQALCDAAQRGVIVNVLIDGFGSQALSESALARMKQAGVHVLFYRPKISPWTFRKNRLRRLHRKLAVIDGQIGFVGGINIIDDMNVPDHAGPRVDYAVKVEGPLVQAMLVSAQRIWYRLLWVYFRRADPPWVPPSSHALPHHMEAAYVVRDNLKHRRDIEQWYLHYIDQAKHEIVIANAYFVPGWRFRRALVAAATRGVRVRLLLQGRIEYWVMLATHAYYSYMLQHGIEIYEYKKSYMHSKVAVFDREVATVGSSNIDPFSLLLAYEANVFVKNASFAQYLQGDLELAMQHGSERIMAERWANDFLLKRMLSWIIYGFLRLLLASIGHDKQA